MRVLSTYPNTQRKLPTLIRQWQHNPKGNSRSRERPSETNYPFAQEYGTSVKTGGFAFSKYMLKNLFLSSRT